MTPYDPDAFPSFEEWLATHDIFTAERIQNYDVALFLLQRTSWQYERLEHFHRHLLNEVRKIPEGRKTAMLGTLLQNWNDIQRGRKVLLGARRGHQEVHGTPELKSEKLTDRRTEVKRLYEKHPRWSWAEVKRHAAKNCGCSEKTIQRGCADLKKS